MVTPIMGQSAVETITRESIGDLTESNLDSVHESAAGMRFYMQQLLRKAMDEDAGRRREAIRESTRRSAELRGR